ncbi:MAG: phospholipid/cholesterol/gamma-HCH transport system substrate-binding protein [Thermoleophilaceae bacterium]|jgi:virulence factor Mce-like protein|nr:phospholipid/cholesterol/gamma-HCH transport system substrate-binding protein [Thermoleophilaceae bacterium]MEA2470690.1 phospholipid/cholesterol/gamma-HCH transport system substrate-binding protein [Thermoleophilaceae bacterium]
MRGRTRLSPFAAGIATIVAIVFVTYVAFGGRLPWQQDYEIRAVVHSANELEQRSPVRIAGVNVGKVKRVERGPGSTAIVTMAIDRDALPLHTDATLKIRPRLFLEGNFFVELNPGTPSAPNLPEGGTIPLAQTAEPVQLDQILTTLKSGTRADLKLLLHGLGQGFGDGRALRRVIPLMEPAFLRTAISAQALQGEQPGDLSGFVSSAEKTTAALASQRRQLPVLVTALDRTLTTLAARRSKLGETVAGLDRLTADAPASFAALNNLFPTARAFVREARPGIRAAPATLRLGIPVLDQAGRLLARPELPALIAQLNPALHELRVLEPQLGTLLGGLRPITECLRTNALPTLKKPITDPPLTTGRPIYRELLDVAVGLASASQNFTGDGQAVRYHAGFGDQLVTTGKAPSLGEPLVGLTSEPLLGSRPRYRGQTPPPFRPGVPCGSQKLVDLNAETGPAPRQRRLAK